MSFVWHVYHRPRPLGSHPDAFKEPPAVHIGTVCADASCRALEAAAREFSGYTRLSVIADVTWRFMSPFEQSVFLGTFQPAPEAVTEAGVRISLCKVCGLEITGPLVQDPGLDKRRKGRPKKYHDDCAPERVKYWRAREAMGREAR